MRCELCQQGEGPAVAVAAIKSPGKPTRWAIAVCRDCLARGTADRTLSDVVPISDVDTQRIPIKPK